MKSLIRNITSIIKDDVRIVSHFPVLVYIIAFLAINYHYNFKDKVLESYVDSLSGFLFYLLFYAVSYFPVMVYVLVVNKKDELLKHPGLWVKTSFILIIIAISSTFKYQERIIDLFSGTSERYLVRNVLYNARSLFFVILPLLFFWYFLKPNKTGMLWLKGIKLKPFFIFLLIMLPVVWMASFADPFQKMYPIFKPWNTGNAFGMEKWQSAGIFEIFYGLDFISVEMIYRGALVIGLYKLLGKDCLLPMVSIYCFIHFGKPMEEAVSSIFGGYLLGIIAIHTESILGGCIVHIGVAWMMEIFAYGQNIF